MLTKPEKVKFMVTEVLVKRGVSEPWIDRFYQVKENKNTSKKKHEVLFDLHDWTKEPKLTWASACFFISASRTNRAVRVASTLRLKSGAISY